jgi:hypothetical protein
MRIVYYGIGQVSREIVIRKRIYFGMHSTCQPQFKLGHCQLLKCLACQVKHQCPREIKKYCLL